MGILLRGCCKILCHAINLATVTYDVHAYCIAHQLHAPVSHHDVPKCEPHLERSTKTLGNSNHLTMGYIAPLYYPYHKYCKKREVAAGTLDKLVAIYSSFSNTPRVHPVPRACRRQHNKCYIRTIAQNTSMKLVYIMAKSTAGLPNAVGSHTIQVGA